MREKKKKKKRMMKQMIQNLRGENLEMIKTKKKIEMKRRSAVCSYEVLSRLGQY